MYLLIALRNLVQGGKRTWLLGIALALVAGLFVQLLALSNGVHDSMVRAATMLSAGHVNVSGFFKATSSQSAPIVTDMSKVKKIAEERIGDLAFVIDRHRGWAKVVSETNSMWAGLFGIEVAQEEQLLMQLDVALENEYRDDGKAVPAGDPRDLAKPNTAMMFATQAKKLGVTVGDRLTLRTETLRGVSNTVDLTIVAVMRDVGMMSNWNLFVPRTTILNLYGLQPDSTGAVMLYLNNIEDAPKVMAELRDVYTEAGYTVMDHDPRPFFTKFEVVSGQDWTGQKLDLTTWDDEVNFLKWVLTALDSISFLLILVLTGIIGIGIMDARWIAVRERTNEIGTLRAIGMSQKGVLTMFVLEASALGLIAATVGSLLSAISAIVVDAAEIPIPSEGVKAILMNDTLHYVVEPQQVIIAVVGFTVFCSLASIWPAMRAARLPPITAIHQTE